MSDSGCSSWIATLQAISPVIGWLLVITGWKVVSSDQNKREGRKELRSAISTLTQQIKNCEEKAHEYYLLPQESERALTLSIAIKRELQRIAVEWLRIQEACPRSDSHKKLIAFRRSITLNSFDDKNRTPVAPESEIIVRISDSAIELIDSLEIGFSKVSRPTPWWKRNGK